MPHSIAMVSDFFLPVAGGVEMHIYSLAAELIRRGHKVIVITHSRTTNERSRSDQKRSRVGVRYMQPGLKVYYLPILPIASDATLPQYLLNLPLLRNILLREKVQILHGHATLSSMALEGLMQAPFFRTRHVNAETQEVTYKAIRTVFTDHSLFGFGDAVGVLTNKLLAGALRNIDAVVCVSHAGRENTALRAQLDPNLISVVPNAIVPETFEANPEEADPNHITVITVSRLVYRKGIDLLVSAIPLVCQKYPEVRFIIGGDGPKMVELEQMREQHLLQDRITLLGSIAPGDVHSVLNRGHIYLSTSLTEAFGISMIEAASSGLLVVSTKVGGVPEILPQEMIEFAVARPEAVAASLSAMVEKIRSGQHQPRVAHARLVNMYTWSDVAARTEQVYSKALNRPERDISERMWRYLALGPIFGTILCIIAAVQSLLLGILDLVQPRESIDAVPDTT